MNSETMPPTQPNVSDRIKPIDSNSSPCASKGFAGNPPMFIPYRTQEQGNSVELSEAFIKMSQLLRLPRAKPSIFKGDEEDKTKFFLWQTAFDTLIRSAPVTPGQKLHLLYQYLDGRAKSTVEPLQYMVPLVESDIFITYFIPIFSLFSPIFSVFFLKYDYFITIYQVS